MTDADDYERNVIAFSAAGMRLVSHRDKCFRCGWLWSCKEGRKLEALVEYNRGLLVLGEVEPRWGINP